MTRLLSYIFLFSLVYLSACKEVLEPPPRDLRIDDLVLKRPQDVPAVRVGLYSSFRAITQYTVVAGDFMSDHVRYNGTFNDYREFGTKQVTTTNGDVAAMWGYIYNTIYVANFILERLPDLTGVQAAAKKQLLAEAHFLRGLSNFYGAYTYGDIPKVTTTDQETNRNIARTAKADILASVLADYQYALTNLPAEQTEGAAYATQNTVKAALARYYLYQKNWALAEQYAGQVIDSKVYTLEPSYETIVLTNFPKESIFEVGYTQNDANSPLLNNLLVTRREMIPSEQLIQALASAESKDRISTIGFDGTKQRGNDNGWTVRKYGTATDGNSNMVVFRLAEMYLIRAEARAQLGKLTGTSGAIADVNVLRARAKASAAAVTSQAELLLTIERERQYELSFEGHRWYDLVRTGRVQTVMAAFSPNWNARYERWPIPQTEIQRNPALKGAQNPGY
ncbi:RagB/SusD family nutrient uptake outer membrane protein [Larkinella terrae]|uniref:RagB/SusD family nutrient uptake outer membrane protein n=1 Tax=Larkinella terrae TaxID=2025311 RepID=A0A7K0EVF3_9BACT|nr:RagB/SusD family nutrient uptake outer membrane protein [Larkinella terrae]MRS65749.1 RagB/SusD family nutrient uptake outer membrane protein [Larkinella terrae]